MGANTFHTIGRGKTPGDAFRVAVHQAQWEDGHSGYTGTIAEKNEFVVISDTIDAVLDRVRKADLKKLELDAQHRDRMIGWIESAKTKSGSAAARAIADVLIGLDDERVCDKWGPAGCIKVEEGVFLFFGWASS